MPSTLANLIGTLICAICEAIEAGEAEARIELAKCDNPGLDPTTMAAAAGLAAKDDRIASISTQMKGDVFYCIIRASDHAAAAHQQAVASGWCPPGLKSEVVEMTLPRLLRLPNWVCEQKWDRN